MTILNRITKVSGQEHVVPTYNLLCEVTHPNYLGRSIYISSAEERSRPGDELRILTRSVGAAASAIVEASVRALSWSCMTRVTAFSLMRDTMSNLLQRLSGEIK
jgi:hypothetical protein